MGSEQANQPTVNEKVHFKNNTIIIIDNLKYVPGRILQFEK